MAMSPHLFRRGQQKAHRDDAFLELFELLARVYEQAGRLKPDWIRMWNERTQSELPPKYSFGDRIAVNAAHDMRFATALLHRHRWKSRVQPLMDRYDVASWSAFQGGSAHISVALLDVIQSRSDLLAGDERDWLENAIEQFDDATRRRRAAERAGEPASKLVAEGTYQVLYIAIQLSERLIERRHFEFEQRR